MICIRHVTSWIFFLFYICLIYNIILYNFAHCFCASYFICTLLLLSQLKFLEEKNQINFVLSNEKNPYLCCLFALKNPSYFSMSTFIGRKKARVSKSENCATNGFLGSNHPTIKFPSRNSKFSVFYNLTFFTIKVCAANTIIWI